MNLVEKREGYENYKAHALTCVNSTCEKRV